MRTIRFVKLLTSIIVIAASGYFLLALPGRGSAQDTSSAPQPPNPILKRPAFVFSYLPANFDPKVLRSVTVLNANPGGDLEYWIKRGVATSADVKENPWPVMSIDEDGADFGGPTDNSQAIQLQGLKKDRPDRAIMVFQTPRFIQGDLPMAYQKYADLILLEAYAHSPKGYLVFDTEVDNMRRLGLLEKSVLVLGVGPDWAVTKEELLQQVRYIRWIAPECAGIGTFAPGATTELLTYLDELCQQWDQIPTDGRDLPEEVRAIHENYIQPHEGPTLVVSGEWTQPIEGGKWILGIRNIGKESASNVRAYLMHSPLPRERAVGATWEPKLITQGFFPEIPAEGVTVLTLPASTERAWPPEVVVCAPGATVLSFSLYE